VRILNQGSNRIGGIEEYNMRGSGSYPGAPTAIFVIAVQSFSRLVLACRTGSRIYESALIDRQRPAPCETVTVNVTVTNNASVSADEVIQLYLSHVNSSVPVPVKALVAFCESD